MISRKYNNLKNQTDANIVQDICKVSQVRLCWIALYRNEKGEKAREQATQNSLEERKILWADLAVALDTLNVTLHVDFYYG